MAAVSALERGWASPTSLAHFVDALPIPETARRASMRTGAGGHSVPFYRLAMREFRCKVHRDLNPTRFWGFGNSSPGPTIEVRSGAGVLIEWANELPRKHFLPIDHHIHGAEADKPEVRAVVHLHGGNVPPASDGYPENWFVPGKSATCFYPNRQDAAMLWYHDHTMGINRLNTVAGLMGLYIIRDRVEDALGLPQGKYEVPLLICDRMFSADGQLDYPVSPKPDAPWVPEFFGDVTLVNGKLYPYLDVEPRRYRFRLLNGSNARFYHLSLSNGQEFHQIGTDQGLLGAPVALKSFMIAPGERADLLIDFREQAGAEIVLRNDSFVVMQFRVSRDGGQKEAALPRTLRPITRIAETEAVKTRVLTLGQRDDMHGDAMVMLLNGKHWHEPVTENPTLDTVEIWSLVNMTDDSHPIHLHLVRFQILDRRAFEPFTYFNTGEMRFTGPPVPPDANEAGWKDTVQAHPSMVTRIIVRFEGYTGRYVWHCHILEHEDNDMMRPMDILATK